MGGKNLQIFPAVLSAQKRVGSRNEKREEEEISGKTEHECMARRPDNGWTCRFVRLSNTASSWTWVISFLSLFFIE